LSINTYIEVFDKKTTTTENEQGETIETVTKTVCWTGNVPITESQYALSKNNKKLLEDQVIAYLVYKEKFKNNYIL
jgi:hypothetical protein